MVKFRELLAVIRRVIGTLISPWRYSNQSVLEEVRIAKRDANAAKVAVSRLRDELRGEVEPSEEVATYRSVMPVKQSRPIPGKDLSGLRPGTSLSRHLERR